MINKSAAIAALMLLATGAKAQNPFVQTWCTSDPAPMVHNGTMYVYTGHDEDGADFFWMQEWRVYSTQDMVNWQDHGSPLALETFSWADDRAWAGQTIERDGKFYWYICAHSKISNGMAIGVAVSDSPTGPFVDSGAPIITDKDRPKEARGGQAIDVDVFKDPKSGKYYLYWGNGFMAGAELNDDMLSVKKETITLLTPKGGSLQTWAYREGTYVFWRKGKYYFLWSVDDTGSPNYHVCYGTAESPLGPIHIDENSYLVIRQKPEDGIYGTAHNSVLQIPGKDKWYIVYHRINKDYVNHEPGIHREVCIDRMTFDKQGRIIPVVPTLDGPAPLKKK